jgi:FkbM family methyltransferase
MPKKHIGERRSLLGLIADHALFWVSTKIRQRARPRSHIGNIVASIDDIISLRVFATGRYESTHVDALSAIIAGSAPDDLRIAPGGIFVDVGANIGLYPIIFANHFKLVVALEANPIAFKVLEANVALKELTNVRCVCCGAFSEKRGATFYVPSNGNLGWGSLKARDMPAGSMEMQVQLDTLNNILSQEESEKVSLLKIDVEGCESDVLAGASRILDRSGPMVLFEVLNAPQAHACISILRQHGYSRFVRFSRKADTFAATAYVRALIEGLAVTVSEFDENDLKFEALVCAIKPSK